MWVIWRASREKWQGWGHELVKDECLAAARRLTHVWECVTADKGQPGSWGVTIMWRVSPSCSQHFHLKAPRCRSEGDGWQVKGEEGVKILLKRPFF